MNRKFGPDGHIVEAFIEHLNRMTPDDWATVRKRAYRDDIRPDIGIIGRSTTAPDWPWRDPAHEAWLCAHNFTEENRVRAAVAATRIACNTSSADIAHDQRSLSLACFASLEIVAAEQLRVLRPILTFLPLFGFAGPQAVLDGRLATAAAIEARGSLKND